MIHTALSSSSFIDYSPDEILKLAQRLQVDAIEWTSDGFFDEGDTEKASEYMKATLYSGFSVASYGTLFRVCQHDETIFKKILETATALGTSTIRVWAPQETHNIAKEETLFIKTSQRLGNLAGDKGICLCYNLDAASMLNTYSRASYLIKEIGHEFVKLAWEPLFTMPFDVIMNIFTELKGYIGILTSRFITPQGEPRSLCTYEEEWSQYLDAFDEQFDSPDMARYVIIRPYPGLPMDKLQKDINIIKKYAVALRKYRRRRIY
ncbi:MAG TPA: hypothetical protein PLJ83_12385 [Spirochaetales bacterium]|nr:hypothetical protein [Spirochaetales bacterium]